MKEIKVAYDRESFLFQRQGGISKSFSMLIREFLLNKRFEINPTLTFERTNNIHISELNSLLNSPLKSQRHFVNVRSGYSNALTYGPVRAISSYYAGGRNPTKNADIFHATFYRPTPWERKVASNLIVTVHDFIPEKLGWLGPRNPHLGKERLVKMADKILCVSNVTALELCEYYNVHRDRIGVVPHGVEKSTQLAKTFSERTENSPYVLYVGHRKGYKNFQILVEALKILFSRKSEIELVIAGPELSESEFINLNLILGSNKWKQYVNPSDSELQCLYAGALLHCVTSRMEGFGMTILEAMSHSTPVVATSIPVFREVGSSAALYFDSESSEELAEIISKHLDENFFKYQSELSIRHAENNLWERSASLLAEVYHELV